MQLVDEPVQQHEPANDQPAVQSPVVSDAQLLNQAVKLANRERRRFARDAATAQHTAARVERIASIMRLGKAKVASADGPNTSQTPTATEAHSSDQPSGAVPSNDDRAVNVAEFEFIQDLCGHKFTLDACSDPEGNNALCEQFCSPEHSFLDHSMVGHNVWLNAPFSRLFEFIDHYVTQKQTSPSNTSACIVVPRWKGVGSAHPALASMRLIKCFPQGYHLFNAPESVGSKRKRLPGIPWPVDVFYDAPTPVNTSKLAMAFQGQIFGAPVRLLIDSGAKHNYLSVKLCQQLGITVDPSVQTEVTLGSGQTIHTSGTATVRLLIQGYKALIKFNVMPLTDAFELVLGNDWLVNHNAHLLMAEGQCVVCYKHKTLRLNSVAAGVKSHPLLDLEGETAQTPPSPEVNLMSHLQAKRVLRKQQRAFLVMVTQVSEGEEKEKSQEQLLDERIARPACGADPSKVKALLLKYKHVFPKEFHYLSLPPEREVAHTIPLVPGAQPVFRPMFRYSPRELEEIQTQVKELLRLGLIEPCNSPWGAPVLFVPKKNGKLRMCVDWRLLNARTMRSAFPLSRVDDLLDKLHGTCVYSSLDLMSGYHQVRIAPEDQEKTAFRTPFGLYKYKVLPFGLVNAPAVFVETMTKVFQGRGLGEFVVVYLDDILVYSKSPEEHLVHLESVLQTLSDNKLFAQLPKCQFNADSVEYLGHIVSKEGIKPDPKKTEVVKNWPRPQSLKEMRSFLGLANYFRRFIQGYSKIVAPLTTLTREGTEWRRPGIWTKECEAAFHTVKMHLTEAPVLAMPDFSKPFEVVCDASIVAVGAVLLQEDRPIAFESKKLNAAQYNYSTTEQELLAVVHALTVWRCYLEGVKFTVVTDHCPNTFFNSQPMLSRRQARWSEFLQQFDFEWVYRPGRQNVADPLSRLTCTAGTSEPDQAAAVSARCDLCHLASVDTPDPTGVITPLAELIRLGYSSDAWFSQETNTQALSKTDGLWYKGHQIVVPNSTEIKSRILHECHDAPYSGHGGFHKTQRAVTRQFWWPHLSRDIAEYVQSCDLCQRNKSAHTKPAGKLLPLPIPDGKWEVVTVDFVVSLPQTASGFDAICVFVDKLTKMCHLCPTTSEATAGDTAKLFVDYVWRYHGLPRKLISDRGTQFTSSMFRDICSLLNIEQGLSSAFHPQSDGQTERLNRVMEETLRHYVNPTQDDWDRWLPVVEFALNNSVHSSTGATPFFLNYGRHPNTPLSLQTPRMKSATVPSAVKFTADMYDALVKAKKCLIAAQQRQKAYADTKRSELELLPGTKVMLSAENIAVKHNGSRKLMGKWLGPFPVTRRINPVAYELKLPPTMARVHPVFHVSLLKPYKAPKDASKRQRPPPPVILEDGPEHEVEAVLAHRYVGKKLQYLIKFKGYDHVYDEWLPPSQLHCDELLQEYLASPAYAHSTDKIRTTQAKKQAKKLAAPVDSAPAAKRLQITKLTSAPSPAPVAEPVRRSSRRRKARREFLSLFLESPAILT